MGGRGGHITLIMLCKGLDVKIFSSSPKRGIERGDLLLVQPKWVWH